MNNIKLKESDHFTGQGQLSSKIKIRVEYSDSERIIPLKYSWLK